MDNSFSLFVDQSQQRVQQALDQCLPSATGPAARLYEAMRYSVFNGGKRIRPLLVYAAANATGEINPDTDKVATSVELIHAYSLIHDDLPAMDDDDLRRGKATCHIAYDEATAILAGDALQTLAFEQLTQLQQVPAESILQLIEILARASGNAGMVAGQAIDIDATNQQLSLAQLTHMHQHKTGALIAASVSLGAMSSGRANSQQLLSLENYSRTLGLAFQVQDDILDVTADTATLGKKQGADQALNKPTFVSLLGLDGAKQKLAELHQDSLAALDHFDETADSLRAIADYVVNRSY